MLKDNATIAIGGIAVIVIGIIFFLKTTSGKAVGENVAGVLTGFAGGVAGSVAVVANDETINPLYSVGSSIGETIYDLTHW